MEQPRSKSPALLGRVVRRLGVALLVVGALAAGYALRAALQPAGPEPTGSAAAGDRQPRVWTCAMHPQIQLPGPGPCPICGMDLVPVDVGGARAAPGSPRLTVSEAQRARMRVRTVPVERRSVETTIRMSGKVAYDETRLSYITAWVPGRIDELFVDYTGITVREGDHMVRLYSPELYAAQEELLQTRRSLAGLAAARDDAVRARAEATLAAAREKLRLWGLGEEQIAEIEERGEASEQVTIFAPSGGLVIHRKAQEGMYVQTGTRIFTIADLSRVWVLLDAYESDLAWLRYGQPVEFEIDAHPGEVFEGTVSFIDPVLDPRTRTVKVRVVADNGEDRLKPEMFVRARARARVSGPGRVMDAGLAGKWVSPMHPEIVKDGPGECDVCGMALVPAESLGFVSEADLDQTDPLVIPVSAALRTGTRAVVYVEVPDAEEPTYEGREVVLGPRAGDHYVVLRGVQEGERVVVEGNFKIDSALQIQARPSMMNPLDGSRAAEHGHRHGLDAHEDVPGSFGRELRGPWEAYQRVHDRLAADDAVGARAAAAGLLEALARISIEGLDSVPRARWEELRAELARSAGALEDAPGLAEQRRSFEGLAQPLERALRGFGRGAGLRVHVIHCPMAFDGRGASWLQSAEAVRNPYFGEAMPRCGTLVESFGDGEAEHDGE